MKFFNYDTGQRPIYATQRGLLIALRLLINMIVYAPLLVTGYFICTLMLHDGAHGLLWFGLTVLFAVILHCLLHLLKKVIISLKTKGNYWWILLFIFCVAFTCILPAYFVYTPLNYIIMRLNGNGVITFFLVICFAVFVYYKYNFLGYK